MTKMKEIIIILLLLALIYYYRKSQTCSKSTDELSKETNRALDLTNQTMTGFSSILRDQLNSNDLEELKTKLGEKTLDELLEANEDYETEVDTLTRAKNSLEADLLAQSNGFQNRLREKDRETKKLKEDLKSETQRADKTQEKLNSEKQISKGNIERITKLTEQITSLEKDLSQAQKTKADESTIINTYLTTKIKELQSEISTLNLQDSAQFNRSKSLKQIVKVLETLNEAKAE